jgi:hypothetical protein
MTSNYGLPAFYASSRQGENARDQYGINETAKSVSGWVGGWLGAGGCGNQQGLAVASEHPGLLPQSGSGNMPGGCGVDTQTDLLWGAPGTVRMKGPKQVFTRPFMTTPNLALGNVEGVDDESRVIFGHATANRKSIQTISDKQFPVFEPLIPEKEADIPENNYFVEPFLRGGLASRMIPKTRVDLTQ